MRIRNRPAPSVYPPPDLNLNRSFPPPQPQQLLPVQEPPYHAPNNCDRLSSALRLGNNPLSASLEDESALDRSSDQLPLSSYSLRRSGKVTATSASVSSNNDDNDVNIPRKRKRVIEDAGRVQPLIPYNAKVDNGWKGDKPDGEGSHNKARGTVDVEPTTGGILNKGAAIKRGSRVGASSGVMEGSRCSRVNGRGWRCGQQTLVGYSLCEHHLGKSRLRSLSSVKNNVTTSSKDDTAAALGSKDGERSVGDQEASDTDDEPLLMMSRGTNLRIGTVKARSLSSLLAQTNQANAMSQPSFASK